MTLVTIGVISRYLKRILISLSILVNVILGGRSNQTFSARNHEWRRNKRPNLANSIDSLLGQGHCLECWVNWRVRK
jgi:hypothetical protein